jgi:uncharacterized cupin superfamily protein
MVNVGDWYLGQTWTLWCDPNSYAETVDWCGPVGQPSFLAPRPYVVKFIHKSGNETFGASLEQQTTINSGEAGATGTGDQRWPTMVLGWSHKDAWGHIALHAMGQYFGTFVPATAATAKKHYGREECAFMVSGDFRITPADDFLYSFYEGDALGGYGIGFQSVYFNDTTRVVTPFRSLGWVAAYQHTWSPKYRSNVNVSGLEYKQPDLPSAYLPYYYYLRSGMSAFANTFIFFNKNVDMGFEYGFEQATPTRYFYAVNSDDNKVSHNTNRKVEVSLRARF